ncbi:hypothetical protein L1887_48955 [Cichorium endivia]|nr:hypothetical protein L1887_48955 [Cichorium endivia]
MATAGARGSRIPTIRPSRPMRMNRSDGEPGTRPSASLRSLELKFNDAFETYAKLYYENALSSVYLWDLDSEPSSLASAAVGGTQAPSTFAGRSDKTVATAVAGAWDSIHVFEATERASGSSRSSSAATGASASYKLTSTVMLSLVRRDEGDDAADAKATSTRVGTVEIAGSLTRQSEADYALPDFVSHVANVGRMIEGHGGQDAQPAPGGLLWQDQRRRRSASQHPEPGEGEACAGPSKGTHGVSGRSEPRISYRTEQIVRNHTTYSISPPTAC